MITIHGTQGLWTYFHSWYESPYPTALLAGSNIFRSGQVPEINIASFAIMVTPSYCKISRVTQGQQLNKREDENSLLQPDILGYDESLQRSHMNRFTLVHNVEAASWALQAASSQKRVVQLKLSHGRLERKHWELWDRLVWLSERLYPLHHGWERSQGQSLLCQIFRLTLRMPALNKIMPRHPHGFGVFIHSILLVA